MPRSPRRQPEQIVVDDLFAIRQKFEKVWDRCDATGLSTAKVQRTRYGAAGTTFGELLSQFSENLSWLTENAIALRDEAEEG